MHQSANSFIDLGRNNPILMAPIWRRYLDFGYLLIERTDLVPVLNWWTIFLILTKRLKVILLFLREHQAWNYFLTLENKFVTNVSKNINLPKWYLLAKNILTNIWYQWQQAKDEFSEKNNEKIIIVIHLLLVWSN